MLGARLLILLVILILISVLSASAAPRDLLGRPPNIVFILSDDQRPDTIRALGNKHIRTPNLDRLVYDGFTFTHAFCMGSTVGAVCIPSRAMILTGRSLYRATTGTNAARIPRQAALWPEEFRNAGYETIGIGKWHNDRPSYARCFTAGGPIFFGGMSDHNKVPVQSFDPTGQYPTNRHRTTNVFSSELFANAAIQAIRSPDRSGKPFLLYLAFTAPHDPRTPPAEFARLYHPAKMPLPKNYLPEHPFDNGQIKGRDEELLPSPRTEEAVRKELAAYYGMITHMDHQIGRVLTALKDAGKAHNTIVVFASDHGLAIGSHGLLGKQNMYEHSVRAPLIFAGPGVPQGRSDALCYLYDVFSTLCELAGLPLPPTVEGKSLAKIMQGRAENVRDEIFGAYRDVQRMIRTDQWKLIYYPKVNRTQLFDLKADPREMLDLSEKPRHADTVAQLRTRLAFLQRHFDDPHP